MPEAGGANKSSQQSNKHSFVSHKSKQHRNNSKQVQFHPNKMAQEAGSQTPSHYSSNVGTGAGNTPKR